MKTEFLTIASLYLPAIMMPGPSVSLILRNGISYSRKASVLASLGIMFGIACQSAFVLVGLSVFERDSLLFKTLSIVSALFLVYLGFKSLKGYGDTEEGPEISVKVKGTRQFFSEGFLLEILNPIAMVFFLSIFSMIVHEASTDLKILYWLEIVILGSLFFVGVGFLASTPKLSAMLKQYKRVIELVAGVIFVCFGIQALYGSIF